MNKHLKNFLIVFAIIAVVITPFFVYIEVNRDELILVYMIYHHIEYNGHDYYIDDNQNRNFPEGEERGPVYLVNKAEKVISKKTYTAYVATGYEGEENEIFLFFDSASYIRSDYMTSSSSATVSYN